MIALIIRYPEIITWQFIWNVDRENHVTFTMLTIIKSILHTWMFFFNEDKNHTVCEWLELGIYFWIILISISYQNNYINKYDALLHLKIVKYMLFLIILFMIFCSNHFSTSVLNFKIEAMFVVVFFVYFTWSKLLLLLPTQERSKNKD